MAAELGYGTQDVGGFTGDFGADAVAGEDCNFEAHGILSLLCALVRCDRRFV